MNKIERFLSDPRYQALDDAGKKEKLDLFFNKYVTQDARYSLLDEEGKARVYSKFMSKYYGEPEAKAPKQKTLFSGLKSELKGTMSLTQSAEAISTGEVETQTLDRRNKAYQKVMADREEALRIIERERNLKQAIPQDRVAAGQQYIKKVKSMQDAPKYPIKSQYTAAMERLQPNYYTDPIERQVAHEIVNKEKLANAQREYQRIAERTASATPEERKEIAKSLAVQQTLIDYYATGMTAAERAAYQAGQEGSESFRMVKALGAGSIDLASSVYQLFNPDSKFARTINAYSAGLLEQSGNPLEDAFAQVFYSMPMTLGYFMTSGILGTAGTATKAASIATKAGEVASLMHSVNINAYMTAKSYSDAISGYGSATAVPEGVFLAGSIAALVESSIEMLSDTAQAKIVLGQAKRIGRRGAEQIIKNSLSGKISGYGTRLATGMAESAITEFTEEVLQGASWMIFDVMSNQREVPSLEEAFKELMYSGAVGALGGITFGLGGGIMVQSSNYQNWREVKKQAASGNDHAARLWEARSILDKSNPNGEVWKSDVQRAYDVIKSDLHAVAENRYQEDNPSIAQAMAQMYDAYAMVDMIKSPQQEAVREAMQAGVQRILDQKRATAIQEPTQQAAATEPQSVEDTIVNLLQEGDIEAAENALNEAVKNRVTGINVPYLRTLVNESKAYAERTAKEAAAQKERRDIIDRYGKYADMSHSELQDEAKKRGLKAGGKSTDIMARLKESDQAKPKAETTTAKPAAKKPFTTNEPTEQQQDRAIKESLIAEETPKKASKYESMGYNALQKEAKKRGINSFGVKKAELIRQLEEKAADTEKTKEIKPEVKVKVDHFSDPDKFYRVITGDGAFNDLVESGVVRAKSNLPSRIVGSVDLGNRGTAYPSFRKGSAAISYARGEENHYIIETTDQSIKPSTQGRHGKGTTMFPTNANGDIVKSLPGSVVNVYKHIGNGEYELVYSRGAVIAPTLPHPKPEAELNVLKKELADIYRTLSLLKEEYDRLLKIAPDDRTAEQDKRIEYIDDLSKIRTIRKSEIETEIAGYESQKSEHPKPEAKAKAGGKSTDIIARLKESDQTPKKASKYESMGYNALQKEAKKRGINSFGVKKAELIRQIEEKDSSTGTAPGTATDTGKAAEAKVESVKPYSNHSKMNREALRNEKKARLRSLEEMKARGVKSVKIGAKQMTIDKAIDVTRKSMDILLLDEYNAEQKVSPTLSEDVKWKIYKARKEFERYAEGGVSSRISKKEFDNALRKLNALESEYGVPNTRADGTRGGDIYEQKDVTPIEYTGKSDGKIDRNLVDAIKSGEAWMDYNATTSEEWNIAIAEMKEEGTFWGIKDQDIVDQGTKIMDDIDELLDQIDNIDNATTEYLDDLDESGTYISDEEINRISDENRKKIKEIEAKIKVLQEKHKDLWDNAKSDQASQDTAPSKVAEDSKSEAMSRSNFHTQYRQAQEGKLPKGQIDAQLKLYDAMMDTYAKEMGITIDEAYAQTIESVTADEPVDGTARRSGARYRAVEEKNLVTIHNLEVDNLEKALSRGGIPMPSIAIVDIEKTNHKEFGDVSLIASPEILDVSRKNPVYTQDAWTPNHPSIRHEVARDSWDQLKGVVKEIQSFVPDAQKSGFAELSELYLEQNINDNGYENALYLYLDRHWDNKNSADTAERERHHKKARRKAKQLAAKYPVKTTEMIRTTNDRNGNARYIPNTLENVMKHMERQRSSDSSVHAINHLIGKLSPRLTSIAQVKKNRDRLTTKEGRQEVYNRIEGMIKDLAAYAKEHRKQFNWWEEAQVIEDIYDIATKGLAFVRTEYKPGTDFSKFFEVINEIKDQPSDIFEAKPRRVIKVNEFVAAVIPTGTKASTAKALRDAGLKVVRYEAGNDEARFEAVKRVSEEMGVRYQTIQGYIQKMPNGKYRIGIMQPNVTTGLHEQAHLGKSLMEIMAAKSPAWASRLKAAEEWCGVKDGNWTTEAEEKFANGYVKFLADGSAPNGKLKTIFAKIKEWIGSILQGLADVKNLDVSNEMRGVYLSMLGISEGKRNLTSEQKVLSIKLKSAMKQDATSDPLKLETEIDRFANNNMLILEGKRTGNKTSFYLNRIDDGKTMIEIHHSNGEYEVNGYHAANNQEVMEQITRILGDTRYQITDMPSAAEIAEAERQMAEVRAKYEGTDQWMKAPNGKPTKLNERQWLQVRTQNFKDWFGDWENDPKNASKVVDENGEPLVVYHGTGTYKEFSKTQIFNPEMLGTATNAESAKKGFFFAESKGTAVEYAGLDQIESPFRSWLDMPSSINEIIGDIRKVILETDAEYVPSTVWEAYGQFVEDIFNSKSNEERLELYLSFKNNESLYYDVMEQEIPQDIIDDAEESLLQDRGFYVERVEGDEDYQEYLDAKEEVQDNAYDLARSIFFEEKIGLLSGLFSGADRNKLEPHIRKFDFSKQYDPNDFKIMQVFLSVKNPLDYYFKEGYRDEKFNDLMQKAIADNKDGAIFRNVKDGGGFDNIYVAIGNTQIKSATGNVGTFSERSNIRYQIDNAIQSASPDMQDRIAKIMEKQKKVQQAANATYRELTTKIGRTTSVYEWDSLMRKSLVTAIRNAFPGAAPMNIEKYAALEETLGELDPGLEDHAKEIKRIKAQLRRMVAMDKKFRDALEDVSGFSDIADIPFEGLFSALENTNPAAYDRYFKDETFDILLKALPKIKTAYDGQFTMQTLQRIVDVILNGNDPNVGRDVSELAFLQPQRLFAELFGKAGINTINYAYHGTLKLAAYEMEYTPHLREINRLLMTADNNRGSAYDGDDLDIIGRTIFEVDGNSEISNKLETIQERLAEWAEENNAVINSKDVEEIYNEKEYLKDIMRGFIAEWNANPERTQKIGIREDYDNPRKYNWGDISDITTKGGKYLYTPGNARERSKQDFSDGLDYDTNIFNAYSNYMYSMTRYMAFYDLANYVEGSSILYASKGGKAGQKKMASGFDLDLSLAQHKSSAYASKMIEDYVRNTIGYHKKDTPKGRLLAAARTNVYASLLASNVIMTVLNFNQRNLIHSVVDQNIAKQVKTDVAFWTGLFKPSNEEYPTLSGIMQAYVTANQSLIAELAAEAKRSANQGRTALTRAYYKHSAYYAEILRLSPFSLAELGNRAYAHAAGVYQVTQNSMAYKEYVASGMSRHQAMERALSEDSNLRRAAITYGGIINAEINADANRAFSPHFFGDASKIKKVATFLRYGVTIALLELRTYGGARDIKSLLSPDLFRLLTSGNVKAATAAQTIQAGAIMKSMLHPKRIAELVRKGQVSTAETSKNLITVNEVNMVRDAITWALDEQAKYTEEEFHNIIRGKSGAKRAMAALMSFSVSEVLLRSLLELLFSLIPWWQGKKKFIETDVIENIASVLGLFQGLKTASNVRLGATLAPDLGAYNPTAKTTTKALSQYVLRLTPYAGLANYMGKVFTGKYFSDLFWDEVYD